MSACTVYYNPRCSKCSATLALLAGRGITPRLVDYQQHPPHTVELTHLAELLGEQAQDLLRRDEAAAAGLQLAPELPIAELAALLHAQPQWMQRPVVVLGDRALIARPPERVLELF